MALPNCLDCKYAEQGHPCRKPDGTYDFDKVGRALVLYGRSFARDGENLDPDARERHAWAGDCAAEVEEEFPDLALPLAVAAADACETPEDAAFIAAGLLENAILKHGPALIGPIEQLAAASPKFRYFLSGIWSRSGGIDQDVWRRLAASIGGSARMDDDGRAPHDGGPSYVLSREAATSLLVERITASARRLGLVER